MAGIKTLDRTAKATALLRTTVLCRTVPPTVPLSASRTSHLVTTVYLLVTIKTVRYPVHLGDPQWPRELIMPNAEHAVQRRATR